MLRTTALTLFVVLAATGCKKDKKTEPAAGSASGTAAAGSADTGSGSATAGSAAAGSGSADTGSAAAGSAAGSAAAGSAAAGSAAAGSGSAAASATFEPKWEKYESKEGNYTIELPAKPEEQAQGGMKIVGAQFGTTASDSRTAMCGVAYMDLPPDALKADPKVMLDGATASHKANAKVIEEKDLKLGKNPGRSIVVENSSHRKWMRAFIANKRIYVLTCGGPFDRGEADGKIATKTLDSFKLTK